MHPLELSTKVIDSGVVDPHVRVNRVTNDLWELGDGLAIVENFSHCAAWDTGEGLACFDASGVGSGAAVTMALRGWRDVPVSTLVYTHGHADHVGGSVDFARAADDRGEARPRVVAHANVQARLDRYAETNGWNVAINKRQFGGTRNEMSVDIFHGATKFLPSGTMRPEVTFERSHELLLGGQRLELHHARGETDDHLWAWLPEQKWMFTGDFVIWNFPNAGNPQKVQRYALEWATALRRMIDQGPELLVPAHGLPIEGRARIAGVLDDIATALESLVRQVLEMMNANATLDEIVHTVRVPEHVLAKPYLRPLYDEPEFVVRGIWRLYGGWWDGAASRLKPAPDAVVGAEVARLAGGAAALAARATELAGTDLRLAGHLADWAGWAAPDDPAVHAARAAIYQRRRDEELSLMAKGIFKAAARESQAVVKAADGGAS